MTLLRSARVLGLAIGVAALALSCKHKAETPKPPSAQPEKTAPKPYLAHVEITASADVNPDATSRPSPVVVRIYQLNQDSAFNGADFFALYDGAEKVLTAQLVGTPREVVVAPSERKTIDLEVLPEARFIGVLAAFRDIRSAQWRAIAPSGSKDIAISVQRARVIIGAGS
jgi:type VI secretion system protein VasD